MWRKREIMIHTDEDDEFERIERENKIKGQPYHYVPQRTWVGLTYEDMVGLQKELFDKHGEMVLPTTLAMAVEAKLKEKNT
jgi:hypothetical protein